MSNSAAVSFTPVTQPPPTKRLHSVLSPEGEQDGDSGKLVSTDQLKTLLHEALSNWDGLVSIKKDLSEIKESLTHAQDSCEEAKRLAEENKDEIESLNARVQKLEEKVQSEHNERLKLESYSRRSNLKFLGIPEEEDRETDEKCEAKINSIVKSRLGFTHNIHIERCHRVGRKVENSKYPRPMIVKFSFFKERQLIWKGKKKILNHPTVSADGDSDEEPDEFGLKSTRVVVKEDFPPETENRINKLLPVFFAARQQKDMEVSLVADRLYINGRLYTVDTIDRLPPHLHPETLATKVVGNLCLFWRAESYLSNFYKSKFVEGNKTFCCMEQYYCFHKACAFRDENAQEKIMQLDDPKEIKQTKVKNFKSDEWGKVAEEVMKRGLIMKFDQNEELKVRLLETGDKIIAEASPSDTYWGIGLKLHDKQVTDRKRWGKNRLGHLLMEVRAALRH